MSEPVDKKKSWWDIYEIVVVKTIVGLATAVSVLYVGLQIQQKLTIAEQNTTIVEKFSPMYHTDSTRRLAPYFIKNLSDPKMRYELCLFMVWDNLEKHISKKSQFTFDEEASHWHLFGQAVEGLVRDDPRRDTTWNIIKEEAHRRWDVPNKDELNSLFKFVDVRYLRKKIL